jgi:tRNA/rRNA methyltransferase
LPLKNQRDRIEIVLVSPRNPLNIGAAARAMANFGFRNLTVVSPWEPHWREAKSAIGADALLQNAKCAERLSEAVADCTLVFGTASLTSRQPEQPVVSLPNVAPLIHKALDESPAARIAIVFGPEKRGLTREDLALCHHLLTIPTDPAQPSLNLGQAVAVCLYALSTHIEHAQDAGAGAGAPSFGRTLPEGWESTKSSQPQSPGPPETWENTAAPATSAQLNHLADLIEETMQAAGYSPANMHSANQHDTHLLLRRLRFTDRDIRRVLGFFRRVLWRLRH